MKKVFAFLFVVTAALLVLVIVILGAVRVSYPIRFRAIVVENAEKYSVDEALVFAVIKTESSFSEIAVSSMGAKGLMQIMPSTADWIASVLDIDDYSESRLLEPELNIMFGCFYLSYLFGRFETIEQVLAAYNMGETKVRQIVIEHEDFLRELSEYKTTYKYVEDVLRHKAVYQKLL